MTVDRVSVLSSRRAYEFRVDDIRLSMLSTGDVSKALQTAFSFESVTVGAPPALFGEVQNTFPPGLMCQLGEVRTSTGPVPIRALMFDSIRMVIDIAGPSSGIETVRQAVMEVLSRHSAPDGQRVLGEPIKTLDQSDLTFHADIPVSAGVAPDVLRAIEKRAPGMTLVSTMTIRPNRGDVFPSSPESSFILEPRAGSNLSDHYWFSSAPLDSTSHAAYLEDLQGALVPKRA
jgi:hypothetical protein